MQSDADGCNSPGPAVDLFAELQAGPEPKWFVTLFGASHLAPYTGGPPWANVVARVTTDFFELELRFRAESFSATTIAAAGDVGGVAAVTTSVSSATMPTVAANDGCGIPAA